jgi:hypothetical protein
MAASAVPGDPVERLQGILRGTIDAGFELKVRHGFGPAAGSQGRDERDGGFRVGRRNPVQEAFDMAETRLVAASSQLGAASELLPRTDAVYSVAALARTALETSVRAAWLYDPAVDARPRGLRGMAELLYAFREESKYRIPGAQSHARRRMGELVEGAKAAGLLPSPTEDDPQHFGEPRPGATDIIRAAHGEEGELVYRELSAVAHGNPTALIRWTTVVPVAEHPPGVELPDGVSLTSPAPLPRALVPLFGVVWQAYMRALENKVDLFGWDRPRLRLWSVRAGGELIALLRSVEKTAT